MLTRIDEVMVKSTVNDTFSIIMRIVYLLDIEDWVWIQLIASFMENTCKSMRNDNVQGIIVIRTSVESGFTIAVCSTSV